MTSPSETPQRRKLTLSFGALLFLATFSLGVFEARTQGVMTAENDYLDHIDAVEGWLSQVKAEGVSTAVGHPAPLTDVELRKTAKNEGAAFWEVRRAFNPHPPFFKYLALAARTILPPLVFPVAERIPTALVFAGGCTALFFALCRARGQLGGFAGAFALATLPRFASFAGACTPDMHIAEGWLWVALSLERYEETRRRRYAALAIAAFSVGLASKISMLPVVAPLGVLMLVWRARSGMRELAKGLAVFALMLAVGVGFLILTYPFLWPDPLGRLTLIVSESQSWAKVLAFSVLFFGKIMPYTELPWYFGPTIIFFVTPPLTLVLALLAAIWPKRRDKLWQIGVAVSVFWLLFLLLPNTPKYDNERGLMALFPFIALLAGIGAADAVERLSPRFREERRILFARVSAVAVCGAMAVELLGAHPFPLSYFTPLIGGAQGAARLGFEPTYAMEVLSREVLDDFQSALPQGAGLTIRPMENYHQPFLARRGFLRPDLRLSKGDGPFFILVYRHGPLVGIRPIMVEHGTLVKSLERDGVPLAELWYLPNEGLGTR